MITSELVELFDFARHFMSSADLAKLLTEAKVIADGLVEDGTFTDPAEVIYTLISGTIEQEIAELDEIIRAEREAMERDRDRYLSDDHYWICPYPPEFAACDVTPQHDEIKGVA